jgi:phosphoenolpyruvate---glycerone phosphotransferase subunit DhaK
MEIGMGIHGEPGIQVGELKTADEIVDIMMDKIMGDIELNEGDEVSVMVNGLGATPLEEQLICYRRVHEILESKGIASYMPHIGEFATSMEMSGVSITLFKLDEELKGLLSKPASTPFYTNHNK